MLSAELTLEEVLKAYDFGAPVVGALRYGKGHINDTFCVHTQPEDDSCRCFILQRISIAAFQHPQHLMENIIGVTTHLARKILQEGGDPLRETLRVLPNRRGEPFTWDYLGGAWRVYPFVEGTLCCQSADTPERFAASGRAFGRFQRLLGDYPAHTLHETIPRFHDTEYRLEGLTAALTVDPVGRAGNCRQEIAFALARSGDCSVALEALRSGRLPLRVTHNDTKLNNVLLDRNTGAGLCVIDLDTVMPGLSLYDFGDSIRFGAARCAEDERDLDRVNLDLDFFQAYTKAFLQETGNTLTRTEVAFLPWGARLMALECGIRFLTDYLDGDRYFHTSRPDQNLDRARTQFRLVAEMEILWNDLEDLVWEASGLYPDPQNPPPVPTVSPL